MKGTEAMNDYFQTKMFNPQYVNPDYFHLMMQQQNYEAEQNKKVADAVKAMHDLCEAIRGMDYAHQQTAFRACLIELGRANNWK